MPTEDEIAGGAAAPSAPAPALSEVRAELATVEAELQEIQQPAAPAPAETPRTAFVLASGAVVRIPASAAPSPLPAGVRQATDTDLEIAWPQVSDRDTL